MNIIKKSINELKFHPMNEQIYGVNEDISELKEDIRKSGDVMTLVITPENVIISGHRRIKACRELVAEGDVRFNEVNCEVREFSSEDEEISYLIRCNHSREKTREQKARESEKLLEAERALAAERQKSGVKTDLPTTLSEGSEDRTKKGDSRDIAAEQVGFNSGIELERSIKAVKKIDELTKQDRVDDAQLIRNELNNGTASAAEKLAKYIDELSDEDKQDIIQKKVSVNKITSKTTESKTKKSVSEAPAVETVEKTVDNTADIVDNTVDYNDDKGEIEFAPPDKSKFDTIQNLFSGLEDRTVTTTFYANPKNCTEFENIVSFIKEWLNYTLTCNEENLLAYVKRSIETGKYGADYDLLSVCENYVNLIRPFYKADAEKVAQENQANDERRKKADEEAERKRLEVKERVRRESIEKSRKFNQDVQEAKRKSEMTEQENSEGEEW